MSGLLFLQVLVWHWSFLFK